MKNNSDFQVPDLIIFEEFADEIVEQKYNLSRDQLKNLSGEKGLPIRDDASEGFVAILDYRQDHPETYGLARLPAGAIFGAIVVSGHKILARDTTHFTKEEVRTFAAQVSKPKGV